MLHKATKLVDFELKVPILLKKRKLKKGNIIFQCLWGKSFLFCHLGQKINTLTNLGNIYFIYIDIYLFFLFFFFEECILYIVWCACNLIISIF